MKKKKERWRTSFLFSLPFWSCSFQASTVWQPITCPSSAAISLFFSKIFSENKQINTQKEMSLGVFYLLPINKQTKLSDPWKYGPQFCNKFTMLPLRMRTTQCSRFSCKPRKVKDEVQLAVKLLLWDVYKRKVLKLTMEYPQNFPNFSHPIRLISSRSLSPTLFILTQGVRRDNF